MSLFICYSCVFQGTRGPGGQPGREGTKGSAVSKAIRPTITLGK